MTITKSDLLYYLHPKVGGMEPMVAPGTASFARDGPKHYLRRSKRYAKAGAGKSPVTWTPDSYPGRRTPVLELDAADTPVVDAAAEIDPPNTVWSAGGIPSITATDSIFDSGFSGWLFDNTGDTANHAPNQAIGTFSGATEVCVAIIERPDVSNADAGTRLEVRDNTDSTTPADATFDLTTGSASLTTGIGAGMYKITDQGPNGGVVWYCWLMYSHTAGQDRFLVAPWVDAGEQIVAHYCNVHELRFPPAPIPYSGSPTSRLGDEYFVRPGPKPGGVQAWYLRFLPRKLIGQTGEFDLPVWHGDGSDPSLRVEFDPNTAGRVFLAHRDKDANAQLADIDFGASPSTVEDVEMVYVIRNSDGANRLIGRTSSVNVKSGSGTPTSWTPPSSWGDGDVVYYNQRNPLISGGLRRSRLGLIRHYGVSGSAMDNDPFAGDAADVMDEMAAFYLPPAA